MYKFFLLSLLAVALGQGTSGDVEKVRRQISGTEPPATGSGTDAVPEDNSCLSNKIKGICVRYYLCDHVDVGHDVSDRNCPSYFDVCCQPSHVLTLEDLNINRTTTNRKEQVAN
ncbi:uncharacterized protein LOC113226095 [Hyposmocoma kahamanoa]|uniref:uncharacterized protein LOC113226095 n=1 Tax=Hyposmocoma kahamanoa TaxID=1477025 RepID=UPI000E6D5EB2|nr:uncharacterized protein LOC113226095 [Hyposmocoma kahamanoa]